MDDIVDLKELVKAIESSSETLYKQEQIQKYKEQSDSLSAKLEELNNRAS